VDRQTEDETDVTVEANHAIHMKHTKDVTETNALIYATGNAITQHKLTQKQSKQTLRIADHHEKEA